MGDSFAALASPALKSFANLVKKPVRRATFLNILRIPLFPEIPGAIFWRTTPATEKWEFGKTVLYVTVS